MKENKKLKFALIFQSFGPLFFILCVKHFHCEYGHLINSFVQSWDIQKSLNHSLFGEMVIFGIGIVWLIYSVICIPAFSGTQKAGFNSYGEMLADVEELKDSGASFMMTFLLPLLIEDLDSIHGLITYIIVIFFVFIILYKSNLYYQNPVLTILGYHVFSFRVYNAYEQGGMQNCSPCIGITRRHMVTTKAAIRWKYISDNVFVVYNE